MYHFQLFRVCNTLIRVRKCGMSDMCASKAVNLERSPRNGKYCCIRRKMMLFQKVLFLPTTFPKCCRCITYTTRMSILQMASVTISHSERRIVKNSIFLRVFINDFQIFIIFGNILYFTTVRTKPDSGFLKFFVKYAKIMHFCHFLKLFLQI